MASGPMLCATLIGHVEKCLEMLRYPEAIARRWDIESGPNEAAKCKTTACA